MHYFNIRLTTGLVQVAISDWTLYIIFCLLQQNPDFIKSKRKVQLIEMLRAEHGHTLAQAKLLLEYLFEQKMRVYSDDKVVFEEEPCLVKYLGTDVKDAEAAEKADIRPASLGDLLKAQMGNF